MYIHNNGMNERATVKPSTVLCPQNHAILNVLLPSALARGIQSRRVGFDLALIEYTYVLPVSHVSARSCTCVHVRT